MHVCNIYCMKQEEVHHQSVAYVEPAATWPTNEPMGPISPLDTRHNVGGAVRDV